MRAAGIRQYAGPVESLELSGPGELRPDEVLLEARSCGMGNWDDIARTGGWDLGRQPPMALGVEAAGVVAGTGSAAQALGAVKNGERLATITSDPPDGERGIEVSQVYVAPDGPRLARLGELLAAGTIGVTAGAPFPLEHAARALAHLQQGTNGQAVVLQSGPSGP